MKKKYLKLITFFIKKSFFFFRKKFLYTFYILLNYCMYHTHLIFLNLLNLNINKFSLISINSFIESIPDFFTNSQYSHSSQLQWHWVLAHVLTKFEIRARWQDECEMQQDCVYRENNGYSQNRIRRTCIH